MSVGDEFHPGFIWVWGVYGIPSWLYFFFINRNPMCSVTITVSVTQISFYSVA